MNIIELFTNHNLDRNYWINKISESNDFVLSNLLKNNQLKEKYGRTTLLYMLVEKDELLAYLVCSFKENIETIKKSYWISFFYSFNDEKTEEYRALLLDYAECVCTTMGKSKMYVANNTDIYEKYGYIFLDETNDNNGQKVRVYAKELKKESQDKQRREKLGNKYKAQIVKDARYHIDSRAYCGLSCNHCFLGEYCGGCKSNFNCCSFGGLYDNGQCPNEKCATNKKLNGCYECEQLYNCEIGFFNKTKSDGALAAKAMCLFIKKYGNENLNKVQDELNEIYSFKKAQEVLNGDLMDSLNKLEDVFKMIKQGENKC